MNTSTALRRGVLAIVAALVAGETLGADPLREGFIDPPGSARPRVWWHWMNGNVTHDGIAKDLAWLKSVGVGGVQNFDANLATPQIVAQRLVYMHPDWKQAFRYAVEQADRLGLEFAIAASPGWSETGGPWVKPADGLKKLVWSETRVEGGRRFTGKLAAPPQVSGPFQDLALIDELASLSGDAPAHSPQHYADVAVVAVPAGDSSDEALPKARDANGAPLDGEALADGRFTTAVTLPRGTPEKPAVLLLNFATARSISTATFFLAGGKPMFGAAEYSPVLEARVNGAWRQVASLPVAAAPVTASFPSVNASEYRLVLLPNAEAQGLSLGDGAPGVAPFALFGGGPPQPPRVAELHLGTQPRIDRFETKAGFSLTPDYFSLGDAGGEARGISLGQVIDLTSRLQPDGSLDWTPPAGQWRILRMGYSLLGTTNHPATPEATGLEVDKFDGPAVREYMQTYLKMYRDTVGDALMGRRGLGAVLTDSIEVGAANWTPRMVEQFKALRGYDPTPWLPTLTGVIIESRARSDAFLYDFRRTLADLMATEHYGTVAQVAHAQGLSVYGEALEDVRPSLGDDMAMRAYADTPMAALWAWNRGAQPRSTLMGDMKGAASVAHVHGKPYVAAESMTAYQSPWAFAPSDLRRIIDLEFAYGINRPVIHTSVHQPVDDKLPGLSLAIFGQYFTRHETWAGMARPWIDYLARSSYLLQQGRDVADVAYFYGEDQPLTALHAVSSPSDLPVRHAYDFVNADIVLKHMLVEKGELVSSGGARYRALFLGASSQHMTLPVLQRIAALAEAGATVIGRAPASSPALGDDPVAFAALVRRLWSGTAETRVGEGRVIAQADAEAGLTAVGVRPDFQYTRSAADSQVLFVHRRSDDSDLYFVNNRRNAAEKVEARFRITGRRPEIWRADTGNVEPVSYRVENGETIVPLNFGAEDSFFVVFREPTTVTSATVAQVAWQQSTQLVGRWSVGFEPGRGAPASIELPSLAPLDQHADPRVRYFSGVATYTRTFVLPKDVKPGASLLLDLGSVGEVAEVRVNGQLMGTAWHAPFQLDVGAATRAGSNTLEIRVANLWVNRLIGDQQPGATKLTFTTLPTYQASAPLRPSGLIGPVRLLVPAAR